MTVEIDLKFDQRDRRNESIRSMEDTPDALQRISTAGRTLVVAAILLDVIDCWLISLPAPQSESALDARPRPACSCHCRCSCSVVVVGGLRCEKSVRWCQHWFSHCTIDMYTNNWPKTKCNLEFCTHASKMKKIVKSVGFYCTLLCTIWYLQ